MSARPNPALNRAARGWPDRQNVLITGATGVVGQALLPRLRNMNITCLVHNESVAHPGVTSVRGDLTVAGLGLSVDEYRKVAAKVDCVIHCAAVTDFRRSDGSLEATNVGGTANVIAFAEAAGARLYHVSTAYLHAVADGERGATAARYAASKRESEELVNGAEVPHVILRPSVVIGDSTTGAISAFQGLYAVTAALVSGRAPLIPFDPTWPIDFVPRDVVADAIAAVVEHQVAEGRYWLTAGDRALPIAEAVALVVAFAGAELGRPIKSPRFVRPEMFDRLVGPALLRVLPRGARATANRMLDMFSVYLDREAAMPSSLADMAGLGVMPLPDSRRTLLASLRYWATVSGKITEVPECRIEVA
jgi:nucleoside-diphosphate-sugar epimerase